MRTAALLILALLAIASAAAQPQITGVDVQERAGERVNEITITYDLESDDQLWYVDTRVHLPGALDEEERGFTIYDYTFNHTYAVDENANLENLELIITPIQRDPQTVPYTIRIKPVAPITSSTPVKLNTMLDMISSGCR